MLSKLSFKFLYKPKYLSGVSQSADAKKLQLMYGANPIGYLEYSNDLWFFEYSDWFKNQDRIVPLLEFPDKHKKYHSKELWSFFSSRIPSKINLKATSIDAEKLDLSTLLEKFGKRTINNPFVLKPY